MVDQVARTVTEPVASPIGSMRIVYVPAVVSVCVGRDPLAPVIVVLAWVAARSEPRTATVSAVYSCARDLKIRPGSTVALTVAGADTCSVVASGSNDGGKLTLKIEALK
jgi:hypothetical protein